MEHTSEYVAPTYGNWRRPRAAGLGKMDLSISLVVVAGLMLAVLASISRGIGWALVVLAVLGGVVFMVAFKDAHGRSLAVKGSNRLRWWSKKAGGGHVFDSGPISRMRKAGFALPGVLTGLAVSEHVDPYDRPFALVWHPSGTVAVVIGVSPDGMALVDPQVVDMQVARWGQWLAALGDESGLVGAAVTVETAPDSGDRLRRAVKLSTSDEAADLAVQVMDEVVESYPRGSAQVRAWITLTFDPTRMGVKKKNPVQVARAVALLLPGLMNALSTTGAGGSHLVDVDTLARIIRCAYDPDSEALFDLASVDGTRVDLPWDQVGPGRAVEHVDVYEHEGAVSQTWVMSAPPRGEVASSVLSRLIAPHRDFARKRVSILYSPIPSERASLIVERDRKQAASRAGSAETARASREFLAADQNAREEASGAGLLDFALVVTVTGGRGQDKREIASSLTSLSATARLLIRPAYGKQATGFAMGLPLGLRPFKDSALRSVGAIQ